MSDVATTLNRSQLDFVQIVWPAIRHVCGGGHIIPVESVSAVEFAKMLDMQAGIDAWQQLHDQRAGEVLRGLASRVQWTNRPYNTFTIRRSLRSGWPTEYDKRIAAMNGRGFLYPHLTIQAYIEDDRLLSVAVAETRAVIEAVDLSKWRPNPADGSTFYYIPFNGVRGVRHVAA